MRPPASLQDLDRAKASFSAGVFILANQFSNCPNDDDSSYMLAAISIKRYCKTQVGGGMQCLTQRSTGASEALS